MPKLVHHHGARERMMRHREVVGIKNATAAIMGRIDQHNDVLIGYASKLVVQIFEIKRSEIALAIKRVEMATQSCLFPNAL